MVSAPVKYVAEPKHVREVTLSGTADLAYWKEALAKEDLAPAGRDDRAQVMIIAAAARFAGMNFRELSFAVLVAWPEEKIVRQGAYLLHAFNSSRLFAACERVFFATLYFHGDVRVSCAVPALMEAAQRGRPLFRAEMGPAGTAPAREPVRQEEGGWEGPIFLPSAPGRDPGQRRVFFARLRGHTETYPFIPSIDTVTLERTEGTPVLGMLIESDFTATEWAVRRDASHARSKTFKRSAVFPNSDSRSEARSPSFPLARYAGRGLG